jgi:hypothetical protein
MYIVIAYSKVAEMQGLRAMRTIAEGRRGGASAKTTRRIAAVVESNGIQKCRSKVRPILANQTGTTA